MAAGRSIALGLLCALLGAIAGGGLGIGGGLAWTALAETSSFEGYSGFVIAYWMLAGIILGFIAGAIFGARLGRG